MGRKGYKKLIWVSIWFLIVLGLVSYAYVYFNGGDAKTTALDFIKKDGLKALFTAVFVSFGLYLLYFFTKGKVGRR